MIHTLPLIFTGKGEVKDFAFTQKAGNENAYMYEVNTGDSIHYEVFERRQSPVCMDFAKRIYSETEFTETYPKANSFGVWAWSFVSEEKALDRLGRIPTHRE